MAWMSDALDDLITLLDLERIEVNLFRGVSPDEDRQRVFGGQVAGQALVAASRTVDEHDRRVHSLHAYFLLPGDPKVPIVYDVDRIRDGTSFSTRRVVAIQHGRPIFNLQASFHRTEPGLDHALSAPADVPPPESLPDWYERLAPLRDQVNCAREPIDERGCNHGRVHMLRQTLHIGQGLRLKTADLRCATRQFGCGPRADIGPILSMAPSS